MNLELTGKIVLITGGSKGIGLACAAAFAAEGARVAIVSRDAANLRQAVEHLKGLGHAVHAEAADLGDDAQAERAARNVEAALGPIDVLVNSAGAAQKTAPPDLTPAIWRKAMDAKYFTYINAMQAVLAGMVERNQGSIVNIVGAGGRVASPIHLPGGAANAALMLASAGLANAWAGKNVRVNVINPGATITDRLTQLLKAEADWRGEDLDTLQREGEKRIPIGRYGRPDEVADVAVFLASARASYVTGAMITMDGAMHPLPG